MGRPHQVAQDQSVRSVGRAVRGVGAHPGVVGGGRVQAGDAHPAPPVALVGVQPGRRHQIGGQHHPSVQGRIGRISRPLPLHDIARRAERPGPPHSHGAGVSRLGTERHALQRLRGPERLAPGMVGLRVVELLARLRGDPHVVGGALGQPGDQVAGRRVAQRAHQRGAALPERILLVGGLPLHQVALRAGHGVPRHVQLVAVVGHRGGGQARHHAHVVVGDRHRHVGRRRRDVAAARGGLADRRRPPVAEVHDAVVAAGHRHRLGRVPVRRGERQRRRVHRRRRGRARQRDRHVPGRHRVKRHRVGGRGALGQGQRAGAHQHLGRDRGGAAGLGVVAVGGLVVADDDQRGDPHVVGGAVHEAVDGVGGGVGVDGVGVGGGELVNSRQLPVHPVAGLLFEVVPDHRQLGAVVGHRRDGQVAHLLGRAHEVAPAPRDRRVGVGAVEGADEYVVADAGPEPGDGVRRGGDVLRRGDAQPPGALEVAHLVAGRALERRPRRRQRRGRALHRTHTEVGHKTGVTDCVGGDGGLCLVALHRLAVDGDQRGHPHVVDGAGAELGDEAADPRAVGHAGRRVLEAALAGAVALVAGLPLHPVAGRAADRVPGRLDSVRQTRPRIHPQPSQLSMRPGLRGGRIAVVAPAAGEVAGGDPHVVDGVGVEAGDPVGARRAGADGVEPLDDAVLLAAGLPLHQVARRCGLGRPGDRQTVVDGAGEVGHLEAGQLGDGGGQDPARGAVGARLGAVDDGGHLDVVESGGDQVPHREAGAGGGADVGVGEVGRGDHLPAHPVGGGAAHRRPLHRDRVGARAGGRQAGQQIRPLGQGLGRRHGGGHGCQGRREQRH